MIAVCKKWCPSHKQDWDTKCTLADTCDGCSACSGGSIWQFLQKCVVSLVLNFAYAAIMSRRGVVWIDQVTWLLLHIPFSSLLCVAAKVPPDTDTAVCKKWCASHKKDWDTKCTWADTCDGCSACSGRSVCRKHVVSV